MVPSGDDEIDRAREGVAGHATGASTARVRLELLYSWARLLQRLGNDVTSLEPLHASTLAGCRGRLGEPDVHAAIDAGFRLLEAVTATADRAEAATSGLPPATPAGGAWRGFHRDAGQTGVTTETGAVAGRRAWRAA